MKLPQFTIRDLLLSTALIAAGIGAPLMAANLKPTAPYVESWQGMLFVVSWIAAPTLVGAGIFLPFGKPILGAVLGLLAFFALAIILSFLVRLLWSW